MITACMQLRSCLSCQWQGIPSRAGQVSCQVTMAALVSKTQTACSRHASQGSALQGSWDALKGLQVLTP